MDCHLNIIGSRMCNRLGISLKKRKIPLDWLNDGFCDCPLDGLDEPETDACSGSVTGGWAGVDVPITGRIGDSALTQPSFYQCTYELSLLLPLSRVNDGICDCCDGSEETSSNSVCADNCESIRKAQKEQKEKIRKSFEEGSLQRLAELENYQQFSEETTIDIENLTTNEIPMLEVEIFDLEQSARKKQIAHVLERRVMVLKLALKLSWKEASTNTEDNSIGLLEALNEDEIVKLIVGICQLSGEYAHLKGSKKSIECDPLVKAGLDLGFTWDQKDGSFHVTNTDDKEIDYFINRVMKHVVGKTIHIQANKSEDDIKNTLQEVVDEDEYIDDDDLDDDFDFDSLDDHESNQENIIPTNPSTTTLMNDNYPETNFESTISRSYFKKSAKNIIDQIYSMLNDEDIEVDDGVETEQTDASVMKNFDPIAIQKVHNKLESILSQIEKGEKTASDALSKINAFMVYDDTSRPTDLKNIVSGVIYHSLITSSDVVELLYQIIPEFSKNGGGVDDVCSIFCQSNIPTIHREVQYASGTKSIQIPPPSLLLSHKKRCEERNPIESETCSSIDELIIEQTEIPNDIPDGYLNFFTFVERSESDEDPFTALFQPLSLLTERLSFESDSKSIKEAQLNLRSLQKQLIQSKNALGGDDFKYGKDGEFFALKDSCHTVVAAKYEYEICIFGNAYQREAVAHKKTGGTNLGKWKGYTYADDGKLVLEFTGGLKCWNGPQRSARVNVTCGGKGTRLISVSEPDTCVYVMEMESYVACNDMYAEMHGFSA